MTTSISSKELKDGSSTQPRAGRKAPQGVLKGALQSRASGGTMSAKKQISIVAQDRLAARPAVQIFDDEGIDVTPIPLYTRPPHTAAPGDAQSVSNETPTDVQSQASFYQTATFTATATTAARSFYSASSASREESETMTDELEPVDKSKHRTGGGGWTEVHLVREQREPMTPRKLEAPVNIKLDETDTVFLLDLPQTLFQNEETEECNEIRINNQIYAEVVRKHAETDLYVSKPMQTFNSTPHNKASQSNKIELRDAEAFSSTWDMYDSYCAVDSKLARQAAQNEGDVLVIGGEMGDADEEEQAAAVDGDQAAADAEAAAPPRITLTSAHGVATGRAETIRSATSATGSNASEGMFTATGTTSMSALPGRSKSTVSTDHSELRNRAILNSDKLQRALVVLERCVIMNTYQQKLAQYRSLPIMVLPKLAVAELPPSSRASKDHLSAPPSAVERARSAVQMQVAESAVRSQLLGAPVALSPASPQFVGPSLERLWTFSSPLTKQYAVTCLCYNRSNFDLLAVGYGKIQCAQEHDGLVCVWNIKNLEHPERLYRTSSGVLSVDFSSRIPSLLAVGTHDGTVAVYNVKSSHNETLFDNMQSSKKHTGPVWQVKWVEKESPASSERKRKDRKKKKEQQQQQEAAADEEGSEKEKPEKQDAEKDPLTEVNPNERAELLISISGDGRVSHWSLRKGFECSDLMKLKRVANKAMLMTLKVKDRKSDALISRYAGGTCVAFHNRDSNIYLAGTEDGLIHRCSLSYNEQFLDTFQGHKGPVYRLLWSPFLHDAFLSCSGDWTAALWSIAHESQSPIIEFHSTTMPVFDVAWSPRNATMFTCVRESTTEIWDLKQSTLDPIIVANSLAADTKFTSVTFSQNSECVAVGDSGGNVTMYQLNGLPIQPMMSNEKQAKVLGKIIQSTLASKLQSIKKEAA